MSDRMDRLDDDLWAAERAGDVGEQIKCLYSRAVGWYRFAEILRQAGRDTTTAITAARRDETTARQLEAGEQL
ncbi:hypothetical protein ACTXG6_06075 [Pseudonocardia sp. Cha107L01]|uniref:hypothetical protein n=1 Tax=Pseudonocardia sp. Cha107L01 TaxID=3457576 RepID=UPI00403E7C84